MRLHICADLGGGGVKPSAKALLLGLAVLLALTAAWALEIAQAQDEEQSGRIVAQRLADGRTEFGWQPSGGARVLPTQRYFPTDAEVGRWLNSSPVEVEGEAIGRINARLNDDGRIEFAFTPTDGERILTDARYFPTSARPNRWLRSTQITIGPPQLDDPFIAVSLSGNTYSDRNGPHTCGLRESGAIECWGGNKYVRATPPAGSFIAIAVGCAIAATFESATSSSTASGEIECWMADGVLDGIPTGRFTAISTVGSSACGLRESGAIECWGSNYYGQTDAPDGAFSAISTSSAHACGLREDGAIRCWGLNQSGQTDAPAGSFSAVSAGGAHTCGLRESGAIECWGLNNDGQINAPAGSFTAVSAGGDHTCGLRSDGAIECWGENDLDDIPAGRFTAVSAGWHYTCAIRESGAIECWGDNSAGQADAPTQ